MHLDLNLLTALDALLDERSVGGAATRLHVTQPAMSRTLARLRRATGDEILVRSGRVMLPTPFAEEIRDEVHQLVTRAQTIFVPAAEVDLTTLDRTFSLQCNDAIASALMPRLTARLVTAAPGVCLRLLGEADTTVDELRRGNVDIQLTDETVHPADVRSQVVMTDTLATIARADLEVDPRTLEGLAALPHVVISRRGRRRNQMDDILEAHGLRRHVAAVVPTLAVALQTVAEAPVVTAAPALLARSRLLEGLCSYPFPVPTTEIPAVMAWHARHDRDSAHRWLRETIIDVLHTQT